MSIWSQIEDSRATSVPPDGETTVDIYALFSFANAALPEGAQVTFIIGKGGLSDNGGTSAERVDIEWTIDEINSSITPIEGVQLISESGNRGFQCVGIVQDRIVRASDGTLQVEPVAKCSVAPIDDILVDEFTIVAYSDFDKTGTVERLQPQQVKLTVMSGGGVFLSVGERYDPAANEWQMITPMPTGRTGLFCEAVGDKIYAIGGFNGNFVTANEEYDPTLDSWAEKSPLPDARGYGSSIVYSDMIYVIGGYNFGLGRTSDKMHRFNPATNTWTEMAGLPMPLSHSVSEVIGSDIYVMYGVANFKDRKGTDEPPENFNFGVFKYDIPADSWSVLDTDTSAVLTPVSTALLGDAAVGSTKLSVSGAAQFFPNGTGILDRGGASEENFIYTSFDATNGELTLQAALAKVHATGETVHLTAIPESRVASNSAVDGTVIKVFNGQSFLGFSGESTSIIRGSISTFDTATGVFDQTSVTPVLERLRAGSAILTVSGDDRMYVAGGSGSKSDFFDELEFLDISSGTFTDLFEGGPAKLSEMLFARHSVGVAAVGGFLYVVGGGGSGHPPGWLKMEVTVNPETLKADGKRTAGILLEAVDSSGDSPPDGTEFRVSGVIFIQLTSKERQSAQAEINAAQVAAGATESATGEGTLSPPSPKTSILPVLFSSKEMFMQDGSAATILLARSEDPIKEVENLFQFTKSGEEVPTEEALRGALSEPTRNNTQNVGDTRSLYTVAIEVSVVDDFFFGQTDTDATIAQVSSSSLSSVSDGFTFNPETAQQGLSGKVRFVSDIASIPDVQLLTSSPVDADDAKVIIKGMGEEIPFGASPHFDAMVAGAEVRNVEPPPLPLSPPQNLMVTTSDNDESFSSNSPQSAVDEANGVAGRLGFPIFINSFIVTDPISLAARRSRTDVADLEFISFETGGNSFSVVDPTFVDFVIQRIKTSAPSSIGSGVIIATRQIGSTLISARYEVEGVPGNDGLVGGAATNSAEMRVFTSTDNYNFDELGVVIPPNVSFAIAGIKTSFIRYEVTLRSETFDSPILKSVNFDFVEDNVQFLFTCPQTVSGQISELAGTANHHLPSGGDVEIGFFHGDSVMFDRDYRNASQPEVSERGTIMAINRSFDTFIGDDSDESTKDVLYTDDFLVYRSKSGPWSQEAIARVFVNNSEILAEDFISLAEEGLIAFRKKLSPQDLVEIEVQNPRSFRVGLKVTNPTLQKGKLDEFTFMFGATQDESGIKLNRPPRATRLFITPSPVIPGGPIAANFTFVDPDGDEESTEETEVNWFRNGMLVPEIRNLRSFSNSDLVARRADSGPGGAISKGQEWFFTVRPSDGRSFGPLATSHKVIVANLAPRIENAKLESSNDDPTKFTSSDIVTAKFDFIDPDEDESQGTTYAWFSNGVEVKSGPDNSLSPTDVGTDDEKILKPGNSIMAIITPSDGTDFGTSEETSEVTVEGTAPEAKNVSILPSAPSSSSLLKITFQLVDVDDGEDQSTVAWFKNDQRMSQIDNSREVSGFLTSPGEKWQAIVTPNNGFSSGTPVKSNAVVIQF